MKGSTVGRMTHTQRNKSDPLKDNNFLNRGQILNVSKADYDSIESLVKNDVGYLRRKNIIDYSLLVGIHDKEETIE